jgi:hypothetical protein
MATHLNTWMPHSDCPWSGFDPATVTFCEENLCSWITQPSNTWSNLPFIIAGIMIVRASSARPLLKLMGHSAWFLGVGSALFHASATFIFEAWDLLGMYMISGLMLCFNAARFWKLVQLIQIIIPYLVMTAAALGLLLWFREIGIVLFAIQITAALTLEVLLHLRDESVDFKYARLFIGLFVMAFIFWNLDVQNIVCDPKNHLLTGHAVWHVLNAVAIWYIYRFYEQFKLSGESISRSN